MRRAFDTKYADKAIAACHGRRQRKLSCRDKLKTARMLRLSLQSNAGLRFKDFHLLAEMLVS